MALARLPGSYKEYHDVRTWLQFYDVATICYDACMWLSTMTGLFFIATAGLSSSFSSSALAIPLPVSWHFTLYFTIAIAMLNVILASW